MRTSFGGSHAAAFDAIETVLELKRRDSERDRIKLVEQVLGVVGAVVVADAGMVASDDKVRAAIVLANYRVKYSFARPGIAHGGRQYAEQHAIRRIIARQ